MDEQEEPYTLTQKDIDEIERTKKQDELVKELRLFALTLLPEGAPDWLVTNVRGQQHLEGLVSTLIHVPEGQLKALKKLEELKPDTNWYRGGTKKTWGESFGSLNSDISEEDKNTLVIDGGRNGVFDRKNLALQYARRSRKDPVLYTIPINGLIEGIENNQIGLSTEHDYDLVVNKDEGYLEFCRKNLQIEELPLAQ